MPLADSDQYYSSAPRFTADEYNFIQNPPPGYTKEQWTTYGTSVGYDINTMKQSVSAAGYVYGENGWQTIAKSGNQKLIEAQVAAQRAAAAASSRASADMARARAEESRRLRASLTFEMKSGTYAMPFDVSKYINSTVAKRGNFEMMMNMIFSDPRFKKAFPGILDGKGDLKLTPAEYKQRREEARSAFSQAGFSLNDASFGYLMGKNVSPNEVQFRAQTAQFIKNNADVLITVKAQVDEINATRKAQGKPLLPGIKTMKDVMNFVTKQGSKELYATVEAGSIAAAAKRAGLDITTGKARDLAGRTGGVEDIGEATKKFKNIADQIRSAGVELGAFGLDQAALETIEFGGKDQAVLASKAEQALRNFQKQSETELQGQESQLKGGRPVSGTAKQGAL